MPRDIIFRSVYSDSDLGSGAYPVATEEELLEFANKGRLAGGANVLEALLPSDIGNAASCLIANALNFSCYIEPTDDGIVEDGDFRRYWNMDLPDNMDKESVHQLADALGVEVISDPVRHMDLYGDVWYEGATLALPAHIGNAADAFDDGLAFTEYVKIDDEY